MKHLFIVNPAAGGKDRTEDIRALAGKTFQNKDDEYAPYQTLIINEDGSCSIDGTAATWEWDGSKTTSTLIVNILVDGERVCGAILFADGTITGQTSNHGIGGYYFNTSNSEQ